MNGNFDTQEYHKMKFLTVKMVLRHINQLGREERSSIPMKNTTDYQDKVDEKN